MLNVGRDKPLVVAVIQARLGSSRLLGKTMTELAGKPMLGHIVTRVKASRNIDEIVIATTTSKEDSVITRLAHDYGVAAYAGSVNDVLDRFYRACRSRLPEVIVRVTADDPFKDPQIIDRVVQNLIGDSNLDYVSNTLTPTYPDGLDVEAFTFSALERAWREATLSSEREHVTPYIWKNPQLFRMINVYNDVDLSHLRWTVDYEVDMKFAREVYARLYNDEKMFLMQDILNLLEVEPSLVKINEGIERCIGYKKSLTDEARTKDYMDKWKVS